MRLLGICTVILPLGWMTYTAMHAQSPSARVETTAGVHTATFETPRGAIRVHVPSDATRGDTISGAILTDPIGDTPESQKANRDELNGFVLEWQGQRTPVSSGRYEWPVPPALRAGSGTLSLEDRAGRPVSQATVPIDPVPAAPRPAAPGSPIQMPHEGAIGETAVIRARSDGRLGDRSLTLGGTEAELLASSPRQVAFRVPSTNPGALPLRFTSSEPTAEGTLRVLDVSVSASQTQLLRGQRATLTIRVRGLTGIKAPMTMTVVNQSPATVQVADINRPFTISPQQVQRGGTFAVTRRLTAGNPGPFQILASVGGPPSAQFDVSRTTTSVLADWEAQTGVDITPGASELIHRSVLAARLDEFLSFQRAHRGDPQEVFAALLSDYLFDLRDDALPRKSAGGRFGAQIMLVSLRQNPPGKATITEREVRGSSFTNYVSRLTERFSSRQAAGYLFVRSTTPQAPITLDGQRKGDLTDRRFVTPVGDHQIVVTSAKTCRQLVTVVAFQTRVVDC